ncbi:HAD-IA family hydrolase [Aliiroseovarius sediminis]|uniref:HAD-IA family hydrolase n=1 Tax=Aliiroseovarius sediminis TaxID=2925839 RepID=UPI001F5755F3|nr:HAD-IA family hydrolase [Aliiroseovarius sediminis]MCI2395055.1 HAD-IA family hydrolase [Aliiroseovarius sediminis]
MTKNDQHLDAVIFDLDGTLIDSAPDIAAAVNQYLTSSGWGAQDTDFIEQFIGFGPRKLLLDIFEHIGHPTDDDAVDHAHKAYLDNYWQSPAKHTRFFDHVKEDLQTLARSGLRMGICTNKPHALTQRVLEALGLSAIFEVAIGADAVPACKPDPGHLIAVADKMVVKPGRWAYVGDTKVDQATATGANVPFYAVPWGGGMALDVPEGHRLARLSDLMQVRVHAGTETMP